jgi:2-polyprenyl-6-methoxyphenol hydroxylase-like FAD-dependent oxidoreductase
MSRIGSAAVVIGAGIAGLSAARTLADRFDRVVVLDRDRLPAEPVPRKGVPQSEHGHVLLVAGQRALEQLFPGLMDELRAAGAADFDPGLDLSVYRFGGIWARTPSAVRLVVPSRPLLELAIRRRVEALVVGRHLGRTSKAGGFGMEILDVTAVSGLLGEGGRVTGVRLDDGTTLDAELVVDCTGRGSRSNRWLDALGFPAPRVTEVTVGIGYATRLYRRSPGDLAEGQAILELPDPPDETRAGVVLPIEGDRWLISLAAWHEGYPRDLAAFEKHGRELRHPAIADLLSRCEPLTDLAVYHFPASRRRHFEEQRERPVGYLALGDALCSFNPIYGQGMTCAALEAVELGVLLDKHSAVTDALTAEYYRRAAAVIATPWQFATGGDFAFPQTKGKRPPGIRLLNAYSRRIQLASIVDPGVREVFTLVQHLVLDPGVLRKPSMILRVLRSSRRALASLG